MSILLSILILLFSIFIIVACFIIGLLPFLFSLLVFLFYALLCLIPFVFPIVTIIGAIRLGPAFVRMIFKKSSGKMYYFLCFTFSLIFLGLSSIFIIPIISALL